MAASTDLAPDPAARKYPVAFVFVNDLKEWHGGLNYFRSLFLALQSLPRSSVQPMAFVGRKVDLAGYQFPANVQVVRDSVFDRLSPKWIANKAAAKYLGAPCLVNRVLLRHGAELFSHGSPSCDPAIRTIAWIPDFQHLHLPQFFRPEELEARDDLYRQLVEQSTLVIVSSESARKDLQRFAPRFANKARLLRFCAAPPNMEASASLDLGSNYGLHTPYFYIPNQAWAHKNHITAVRALFELATDYPDVKVVCSGSLADYRNPTHVEALRTEIAQRGLSQRFVLLGTVPYSHVARLMLSSVAVINPSLFEGWSTTVEEAKAFGVPLILSDIDVHREQCDHGEAVFFEPLVPSALADRMRSMLSALQSSPTKAHPQAALDRHRLRVEEFGLAYERIVAEARGVARDA
jgi:glycosyltransferase involved in cell wall biosynthesis